MSTVLKIVTVRALVTPTYTQTRDYPRWLEENALALVDYWRQLGRALGDTNDSEFGIWVRVQYDQTQSGTRLIPHGWSL